MGGLGKIILAFRECIIGQEMWFFTVYYWMWICDELLKLLRVMALVIRQVDTILHILSIISIWEEEMKGLKLRFVLRNVNRIADKLASFGLTYDEEYEYLWTANPFLSLSWRLYPIVEWIKECSVLYYEKC